MDPVVIAGGLAVAFALAALMLWRRAADLEEQVRALEAKLAERAPKTESAAPEPAPEEADEEDEDERAEAEESTEDEPSDDDEDGDEDEEASGDDEEDDEEDEEDEDDHEKVAAAPAAPTEQAVAPEPAEPEPVAEAKPPEPEPEPVAEPAPAAAEPEPPPKAAEPDPRRLAALKIVSEAFELARYLDFDAIVEKPSTYRVTVPITAANGSAVRFLEDGMFTCLAQVRIEDENAILHIDTGKGPP